MSLHEGSTIIVNLICGHGSLRATVVCGDTSVRCPQCSTKTRIRISRRSDGYFKLETW